MAPAPPVSALPAYRLPVRRVASPRDRYVFAERAGQAAYGFGDAPPDYAFDYDGSRPWAWQGDNGYETVVEPLPDGGDRYYYYEPGADQPYYVRDPNYGYGYQDGALVVAYDRYGQALDPNYQLADDAGRYFWRARALRDASRRSQHYGVNRTYWQQRRLRISEDRDQWLAARDQNPDWRSYHDQYAPQEQPTWSQERYRREAEAYRYDQTANNAPQAARERDAALAAAGMAGAAVAGGAYMSAHRGQPPQGAPPVPPPAGPGMAVQQAQAQSAARLQSTQQAQAQANAQRAALANQQTQLAARKAALQAQARQSADAAAVRQAQLQSAALWPNSRQRSAPSSRPRPGRRRARLRSRLSLRPRRRGNRNRRPSRLGF